MKKTKKFNLSKPEQNDFYDIEEFNSNADIIDQQFERLDNRIDTHIGGTTGHNGFAGSLVALPTGLTDLNNLTVPGVYHGIITKAMRNEPYDGITARRVSIYIYRQDKICTQEIHYIDIDQVRYAGQRFYRVCDWTGELWSEWREVATMGKWSNANLLINWDFRNPVNQRGQTSYTHIGQGGIYSLDRWQLSSGSDNQSATLSIGADGIHLSGTKGEVTLRQFLELTVSEPMLFTFSVKISALNGKALILLRDSQYAEYAQKKDITSTGIYSISGIVPAGKRPMVQVHGGVGTSFTLVAAKLELGPISTLSNDAPANYGEQLGLRQRYFERFGGGQAASLAGGFIQGSTEARFSICFAHKRIPSPTIKFNTIDQYRVLFAGGAFSLMSLNGYTNNNNTAAIITGTGDISPLIGQGCLLQRTDDASNCYIDIDAEIY